MVHAYVSGQYLPHIWYTSICGAHVYHAHVTRVSYWIELLCCPILWLIENSTQRRIKPGMVCWFHNLIIVPNTRLRMFFQLIIIFMIHYLRSIESQVMQCCCPADQFRHLSRKADAKKNSNMPYVNQHFNLI